MSKQLLMPSLPLNMKVKGHRLVTSDVFGVAERIRERWPNLMVTHQEHRVERGDPWVVSEHCADGEVRLVATYERLDASVIADLQYMLSVPLKERWARAESENEVRRRLREHEDDERAHDLAERLCFDLNRFGFTPHPVVKSTRNLKSAKLQHKTHRPAGA